MGEAEFGRNTGREDCALWALERKEELQKELSKMIRDNGPGYCLLLDKCNLDIGVHDIFCFQLHYRFNGFNVMTDIAQCCLKLFLGLAELEKVLVSKILQILFFPIYGKFH